MFDIKSYEYAKKVYFGYAHVGFFRRILWTFWYLVCERWDWILGGTVLNKGAK